jgi:hypothetical protein
VRRRLIRTALIVAIGLLLMPTLGAAAPGQRGGGGGSRGSQGWNGGGSRGHGGNGWNGGSRGHGSHGRGGSHWNKSGYGHGYWRGSSWCCGGFAFGVGVGTLLTAPFWAYPRVYAAPAYPVYPYPAYAPYPAYPANQGYPAYPAYPEVSPAYAPGGTYLGSPPPLPPGGSYGPPPVAPPALDAPSSVPPTPEPTSSRPGALTDPSAGAAHSNSGSPGASSAAAPVPAGCETVTVAGHWESRVYPDGQRLTVWIPTSTRSVCR